MKNKIIKIMILIKIGSKINNINLWIQLCMSIQNRLQCYCMWHCYRRDCLYIRHCQHSWSHRRWIQSDRRIQMNHHYLYNWHYRHMVHPCIHLRHNKRHRYHCNQCYRRIHMNRKYLYKWQKSHMDYQDIHQDRNIEVRYLSG